MRRPVLFRRLPRLRWTEPPAEALVPLEERDAFDALAEDLSFLDRELMPAFTELDRAAQKEQNRFRRQQVALLVGGFLTSALGALLAALGREQRELGLVVALLAAATTSISWTARQRGSLQAYLQARVRAERMRAHYFMYLGGVGAYRDPSKRASELRRSVAAIKHGREPR